MSTTTSTSNLRTGASSIPDERTNPWGTTEGAPRYRRRVQTARGTRNDPRCHQGARPSMEDGPTPTVPWHRVVAARVSGTSDRTDRPRSRAGMGGRWNPTGRERQYPNGTNRRAAAGKLPEALGRRRSVPHRPGPADGRAAAGRSVRGRGQGRGMRLDGGERETTNPDGTKLSALLARRLVGTREDPAVGDDRVLGREGSRGRWGSACPLSASTPAAPIRISSAPRRPAGSSQHGHGPVQTATAGADTATR